MKHEFIMQFICKWEGGLSRDVNDAASAKPCPSAFKGMNGWHTNIGITWITWMAYCKAKGITSIAVMAERFFNMTKADQSDVFKILYWDKVYGDVYTNLYIANCMASWVWGSGVQGAFKQIKNFIDLADHPYPQTWSAIPTALNTFPNQPGLFLQLCEARKDFFISISGPGTKNAKFQKGWLNRLEAFKKFNQSLFK